MITHDAVTKFRAESFSSIHSCVKLMKRTHLSGGEMIAS